MVTMLILNTFSMGSEFFYSRTGSVYWQDNQVINKEKNMEKEKESSHHTVYKDWEAAI